MGIAGNMPTRSDVNSTFTALGAGEEFIGEWEPVFYFPSIVSAVLTDAPGTIYMQFSPNGLDVDSSLSYTVAANTNDVHRLAVTRAFYRLRYVNGAIPQTFMRAQSLYGFQGSLSSPFSASVQQDADTLVVRSIPAELDIATGKFQGYEIVNKFGRNADVDSGTTPEDIWFGGGPYTGFPTSAEIVTVVSSSTSDTAAGDGARTIQLIGLDANGDLLTETVTLNGTTPVDSVGSYWRLNRGLVLTSGGTPTNSVFNIGNITVRQKITTANIFVALPAGFNQSQVACFTIPAGKTGYLNEFRIDVNRSNSAVINYGLWVRQSGQAPRIVRIGSATQSDSAEFNIFGGIVLPELTDLALRVTACSTTNVEVSGSFDLVLIND